ncbi:MAG: RtcB family protein [Desulfobacterales bacterium]
MTFKLKKIDNFRWELPKTGMMRVPGIIYTGAPLINAVENEEALKQVANVATLPGIVKAAMAMPDIHWGYGFPIGGVAAFDCDEGVISPGGVGYDINCGVRLAGTQLHKTDIDGKVKKLADELYRSIPSGVGSTGAITLSLKEEKQVLLKGSRWAVENGFGEEGDILHAEDQGCMENADPETVGDRALERGRKQLGTLGSGNHFLEVGIVDTVYDAKAAKGMGLFEGQVTFLLHSGSRGLGYQICDDSLMEMTRHLHQSFPNIPDRQLACARIQSEAGTRYYNAMACAANYAWTNRQILLHRTREVCYRFFGISPKTLDMRLVYDVCHNIAKKELHHVNGEERLLCVHRKGATRAFGPGHKDLAGDYRDIGQPILIPGDMGTASYVMKGTQTAMEETFGSTCHGAGRVLSRKAAKKASKGRSIYRELEDKGIIVRWTGKSTMAEEMPDAYKNISHVVDIVHGAGISLKVAKLRPLIVVKG